MLILESFHKNISLTGEFFAILWNMDRNGGTLGYIAYTCNIAS